MMSNRTNKALLAVGLFAAAGGSAAAQPLVTIYTEDFESFPLFVNQEELFLTGSDSRRGCFVEAFFGDGVQCGQPNANTLCGDPPFPAFIDCGDFVNTPFDGLWSYNGWNQEFGYDWDGDGPTIPAPPGVGAAEWQGWAIADKAFWQEADQQLRETFTKGSGRIAVADPDEWDDYDPFGIDPDSTGKFNARITSPSISLNGVTENTVVVKFDSSWRPETNQKAALYVSFDGGDFTEVLLWDSDASSPNFKPDSTNETVELPISNPAGASSMELRWALFDAINNWWWAVDNIVVAAQGGDPIDPPAAFELTVPMFNDTPVVPVSWTQAINATSYDVIFANDADFADIALQVTTTELQFTTQANQLLAGSYFVKVIARNNIGTTERSMRIGVDNACPADLDANGNTNFFDISRFIQLFNQG
ncbi:hypothetical protein [Nodularia spumigena]|uniref:hypothetical protein n=1 Tax=Nodularia spumigena TaxID=70799 RepID=UPI002B1F1F77|nr:hypothetical protein [Nodularia spumigena]MEA5614871.1 hypothetical protein [Nodularia spumigena UHCC 0040]